MPRVVHFELSAEDPERAVRFYQNVFGWEISKWDGPHEYWLISTGEQDKPGINGGLMRQMPQFPARTPVHTLDVDSVDAFVEKIVAAGGEVYAPKMAVPGIGYLAYCKDTEGTIFGIMQNDPNAA